MAIAAPGRVETPAKIETTKAPPKESAPAISRFQGQREKNQQIADQLKKALSQGAEDTDKQELEQARQELTDVTATTEARLMGEGPTEVAEESFSGHSKIASKPPTFLKEFSRHKSPLERRQKAEEILNIRRGLDQNIVRITRELTSLEEDVSGEEAMGRINNLRQQLIDLNEQRTSVPRQLISDFYQKEAKKWESAGHSREDMEKYFSEDHLTSISLSDYILLLKRFPSEMVTHVTRQGVRDHVGHVDHTEGQDQYSDSFMQILRSGRLSPVASIWVDQKRKDILQRFLGLKGIDKQTALRRLDFILSPGRGNFGDIAAVHFALEEVADASYGAEKGNEIFVIYPTPFIASKTHFYRSLTEKAPGVNNDLYVWPTEEQGISINAGIVFIPADAKVDPNTGSKYEIDSSGKPVVNQEYIDLLKELVYKKGFITFASDLYKAYQQIPTEAGQAKTGEFRERLASQFLKGDPRARDERIISTILNSQLISEIFFQAKGLNSRSAKTRAYVTHRINSTIESVLHQQGIYFKETQNTISSKDFWEQYFAKNPQLKPSKIIYYEGGDPSKALMDFKRQNNLSKKGSSDDLGFPEHRQIDYGSKLSQTPRGERFKQLALETIEEFYFQQAA